MTLQALPWMEANEEVAVFSNNAAHPLRHSVFGRLVQARPHSEVTNPKGPEDSQCDSFLGTPFQDDAGRKLCNCSKGHD